jgi:snRNA-activating protein complex subunit 3
MIARCITIRFVTISDKLAPENPCFFCDQCYRPFHYSEEGALLYGDFEVYHVDAA